MPVKTPNYFYKKNLISILLLPLSTLYYIISKIKWYLSFPYKSNKKIICIGNITVGGTGKTPVVIKLAQELIKKNLKIGIISRGYKGKLSSKNPIIVNSKIHNSDDVGDEVYMMSSHFNNKIPICICKNRAKAIKLLEKDIDIIISDDGFQNNTFYKDINILVFDGIIGTGNNFILPAGPLRNTTKSIKKSDAIIINRTASDNLLKIIKKYKKPIFHSEIILKNAKEYKNKEVIAFAGIGNPNKFYYSLQKESIKIKQSINFPDHYNYKKQDLEKIIKLSNDNPILTTEKDYVKIPERFKKAITSIKTDLEITDINQLIPICLK